MIKQICMPSPNSSRAVKHITTHKRANDIIITAIESPSVSIFLVIQAKYQQSNVSESKTNYFRLECVY